MFSDLESAIIAGAIGTAAAEDASSATKQTLKVAACVTGVVQSAISPSAVGAALGDRSGASIESYIQATLKNVFGPSGLATIGTCLGTLAPIAPNADFAEALTQVTFGFASYILTKGPVFAAAGLGFEVGQTLYYLGPNFAPVTVGICLGTPPGKAFGIVDCAKSFTFNPATLYMAPTATGSAPAITAVGTVTATTLVPTDITFEPNPALVSIDPTTNNITATDSPSATPAVVTATSPSTSATGSYQVFVVNPILTPSALAVDTTSSAQNVTVTLLGPNENPILLPTGITWSAQLIKDSDSSSTPIIPSIAGGVATFTIPIQTPPGRLDVSAGTDPAGTSYGFESINVTSSAAGGQTFIYTGQSLQSCPPDTFQYYANAPSGPFPVSGPIIVKVVMSSSLPPGFTGFVPFALPGETYGTSYVGTATIMSTGFPVPALTVNSSIPTEGLWFVSGVIQSWSFAIGVGGDNESAAWNSTGIYTYGGPNAPGGEIGDGANSYSGSYNTISSVPFCGLSNMSGTWSAQPQ